MDHDLLQPSLSETTDTRIFSPGALMAAAFFGGGFATVVLAASNSHRLGRLARDWVWLLLGVLLTISVLYFVFMHYGVDGGEGKGRIANRGTGFALWFGYYLLHRPQYRAMAHSGTKPPSPYLAVIAAIALGIAMTMGTGVAIALGMKAAAP